MRTISVVLLATACSGCGIASWETITRDNYLGRPISTFESTWGQPAEKRNLADGTTEYVYNLQQISISSESCRQFWIVDTKGVALRGIHKKNTCSGKLALDHISAMTLQMQESDWRAKKKASLERLRPGDSVPQVKITFADWTMFSDREIRTANGIETGYRLLTYRESAPRGKGDLITLVFWDGKYQTNVSVPPDDLEPILFDDFVAGLYRAGKISLRQVVELKHDKWFEMHRVTPDQYEDELFLFQLWQAQRVDKAESTMEEYRYQVSQKHRQLEEARHEKRLGERMIEVQRQEAAATRGAILSAALINSFKPVYTPPPSTRMTCTTRGYGSYVTTECY